MDRVGLLACLAGISACTGAVEKRPDVCSAPQGSSASAGTLASADTAFALSFFPRAVASAGGQAENVVLSPYSVSTTLMMVDVGAAGQTRAQIESVLKLPASAASEAQAYAALACGEETDATSNDNSLFIANSLWGQKGKPFDKTFESVLETGYGAPLQQVDFQGNATGAIQSINGWVADKTQGKIPALLGAGDVDATTRLVLVNAIYFKGAWASAFDARQTAPQPFTLPDGSEIDVPTMTGTIDVRSPSEPGLTVLELPYKGDAMAMDFLMPDPASGGLAAFEQALTPAALSAALAPLSGKTSAQVFVPKFSFSTHVELAPVLEGMGMVDVFDRMQADLSGTDGAMDLSVHAVVQQALVQVDEQGTVAAAATAASECQCSGVSVPETIRIDHPFVFLIRDRSNGSIVFMGQVANPGA